MKTYTALEVAKTIIYHGYEYNNRRGLTNHQIQKLTYYCYGSLLYLIGAEIISDPVILGDRENIFESLELAYPKDNYNHRQKKPSLKDLSMAEKSDEFMILSALVFSFYPTYDIQLPFVIVEPCNSWTITKAAGNTIVENDLIKKDFISLIAEQNIQRQAIFNRTI